MGVDADKERPLVHLVVGQDGSVLAPGDPLIQGLLDQWSAAKKAKQFDLADAIRGELRDKGVDVDYLRERLLPMLHSNSSQVQKHVYAVGTTDDPRGADVLYGQQGSKNIFVYPFSLNPEGSNPSGAVNFSKVSHAKLNIHLAENTKGPASPDNQDYLVDVYALNYNWLQIKDGRALLSFA